MANEFDYRLISSIPDSYARGQEQAFQQAMRPMEIQNEFVRQRINQIRLKEAENEFATKMGRQQAAQKFFQPSQPAQTAVPIQTGAAPSYTGNAFAQNMYGQSVETAPARPAGFDAAGYQANRYGAGDIEGAQAIQAAPKENKMALYKPLYDAAVSSGNDAQFQQIVANMKREGLLPQEFTATVTPSGEVESVITVQAGDNRFTDPVTGQPLPAGQYSATAKGNRIVKVTPYVDKTQAADLSERRLDEQERHNREMEKKVNLAEQVAAKKEAVATEKENLKLKGAISKADIVVNKVDEALSKVGFWTTGLTGDIRSTMVGRATGSGAYDLDKTIDTIKANIGFQELADMRAASPTGGALGQIAVRELEFLQAALGSLDKGQSQTQLTENLKAVKTHYQNWKNAVENDKTAQPKAATGRPPLSAFEKKR